MGECRASAVLAPCTAWDGVSLLVKMSATQKLQSACHQPFCITWSNAFAGFLVTLNTSPCFAGHCDWRIPNVKELQSIVNYGMISPASTVPGSTAAGGYWSSTAVAGDSSSAWSVFFSGGSVSNDDKDSSLCVRAVRGGR
jgi:hypothetical protein